MSGTTRDGASSGGGLELLREIVRELPEAEPLLFAVGRIARAIEGAAVVYAADGTVMAESGPAPAHLLRELPAAGPSARHRVGRWYAAARRTATPQGELSLVLATRSESIGHEALEELLDVGEIVLLSAIARGRSTASERARENERLLRTLAEGVPVSRERRVWPRLEEVGFPVRSPVVALAVAPGGGPGVGPREAAAELAAEAARRRIPLLLSCGFDENAPEGLVHAIAPASARRLGFPGPGSRLLACAGLSAPFSALSDAPRALRDAETALRAAASRSRALRERGQPPGVLRLGHDELDLAGWLAAEAEPLGLRVRTRRVLAPLADAPELLETLAVYLAARQRVGTTAAAMYIHPNTVRYRLARVAELTGAELSSPAFIANLYLSLEPRIRAIEHELAGGPGGP
ncbi:MAG: helix-turn-helix domain-containing protein [Pseudoclavibacter sp.]|nr:helix-turn-helix domain-containing protein [Pseudoclavibacter sp.]